MSAEQDYIDEIERWRAHRIERLTAEDGWLNIIGRWWLEPGSVTIGAAGDNDIVLSAGPAHVGTLTQERDGGVVFRPADGNADPLRLKLDKKTPPRFAVGSLLIEVTTLNDRNAVRVRDRDVSARRDFPGIRYFPVDPDWRIVADWLPLDRPVTMTVDTMIGIPTEVTITHKAAFDHDEARC